MDSGGWVFDSLGVEKDVSGAGLDEVRDVLVGVINHEVGIKRDVNLAFESGDDGGPKGDIRDEMTVHDIHVQHVTTGLDGFFTIAQQVPEIGGKNGSGYFNGAHNVPSILCIK